MSRNLFEDDSDTNENVSELKTNQEYAKSYNKFRQKELLKKLKDRDENSSCSSSSGTESSDEEGQNPQFDQEFFLALSSLKAKDPKIYQKETKFFENFDKKTENVDSKKKSKKPFTVKDFERKVLLEDGGIYVDEAEEDSSNITRRAPSPTYVEEQKRLKAEFKKVLESEEEASDDEFGRIFKKRNQTQEEDENENQQYINWLANEEANIPKDLNPLKEYWNNPNLTREEQFLRDYVLNNGYINKDVDQIPTYSEIVEDKCLSDDEKELEKQTEFEYKYNFRFEEPDQEFIKRYPRTIENSVRKLDDRRKEKRQEVKDRKEKEKAQKRQELQILKTLKKKEIEEKIEKLKEVTGNEELAFNDLDLEEDFDPESYDKRMSEVFDENFYHNNCDEDKPECPDIEDLKVEDWDNYHPENDNEGNFENELNCEDEDFNMDCDYDPNSKKELQDEMIESAKSRKNRRRRRNRFMEMINKEKPVFNPEDEKTYADYIDEYYKLDYEDLIGDVPCRFKYVETVPNDFGLTIEEILLAKNKELNQWASLKKAVQIRSEHVENNEVNQYKIKSKNLELKRKIFRSLYEEPSDTEDINEEPLFGPSSINSNIKNKIKNTKDKSNNWVHTNESHLKVEKQLDSNLINGKDVNKIKTKIATKKVLCTTTKETEQKKDTNNLELNSNLQKAKLQTNEKNTDGKNKNNRKPKTETKLSSNSTHGVNFIPKNIDKEVNLKLMKRKKQKKRDFENSISGKAEKNWNADVSENLVTKISDDRLKAFGFNPRKFRNKIKYKSK